MKALFSCIALCILLIPGRAQFGPIQFAFESDVAYPTKTLAGDVDGDGLVDAVVYSVGSGGNTSRLVWFRNLGVGEFAPRQLMLAVPLNSSHEIRICDLDGDGDGDLMINGSFYQNVGAGAMVAVGSYWPAGGEARLLQDLDGDGDVDDVVRQANGVYLLLNNGIGTFSLGAALGPAGTNTTLSVSRADLDGDGLPDLMIGGNNAQVGWYANLGGGNYGPQQSIPGFVAPGTAWCGDIDGDGDNDILAYGLPGGADWFANDGNGNFTATGIVPPALGAAMGDVDGDGDVDFSAPSGTSCDVKLWRNNSGASWTLINVETVSGYNLANTSYAVGDLNGDGRLDLLASSGMDLAGWYPNLGNGNIGPRARFCQTMAGAYDISAADIDLDGDLDLVTASYYGDWVCWYANNGDGTFGRQQVVAENRNMISASRTADVNGDGLPDIITNDPTCAILRNNSGGGSWTPIALPGAGTSRLEVDLDGDGYLDLIGSEAWYENDGNGNFTGHAEPQLVAGNVRAGDMNGDGITDLVIASTTVLLNDGAGNFTTVLNGVGTARFGLADLDGDGDLDVLGIGATIQITAYFNDGAGNLSPQLQYTGPAGISRTILVQDINGDGHPDAVWALSNGYTHQTYYNLNLGNGQLGPAALIDPTAESAAAMILADLNNDAVPDLVTARFRTISWQENYFYNAFRLRGSVFLDFDLSATLDLGEIKVPFRLVRTDANDVLVWTNSAGEYDLPADTGSWKVWHTPGTNFQVTNDPDTLQATLTVQDPIATGLDIGLSPASTGSSAFVTVTYTEAFRCNEQLSAHVQVRNTGAFIPEAIVVDYHVHPDITIDQVWPAADSIVDGHVYWSIDSLGWFQQFVGVVQMTMGPVGSTAGFGYQVTTNDPLLTFFMAMAPLPVTCAYDPNDKLVTPQGYGAAGAVPIETEWFEYTIRFQNTGTDTAFTVVLRDELDMDLDRASMEVLAVSHSITHIEVDGSNLATFRFDRILLPDSVVNEPASHGFIKYRIRPLPGSPHLTAITNSASIYFDLNPPIVTNTTLNTLVDCSLHQPVVQQIAGALLQSSPGDAYQWTWNGFPLSGGTAQTVEILDNGYYAVQVTSEYGCVAISEPILYLITGVGETKGSGLEVWPNPMHDRAVVRFGDALAVRDRMEVVDVTGRVVRTYGNLADEQLYVERDGLGAGAYLLRVMTADRVLHVERLIVQ